MRCSRIRLHGLLKIHVGNGTVPVDGQRVTPMVPSNHIYHDAPRLRQVLDADGFIYLKNLVPRDAIRLAYADVCKQLEMNRWWCEEEAKRLEERDGFVFGASSPPPIVVKNPSSSSNNVVEQHKQEEQGATGAIMMMPAPLPDPKYPFHITERVSKACFGPSVAAAVRQVFGGGAECLNYNSLDLAPTGERHGFFMPSVYMNQGTKLVLTAWVALHDMPINVGGIVCCRGSNTSQEMLKVRETYGQHEVETGDISGDGTLSMDPTDVWNLGDGACPLAVSSFEPGDVVLSTVYTMQSFTTNMSSQWRISAQSRWVMHGDDVGADPRFHTAAMEEDDVKTGAPPSPQLNNWLLHRNNTQRYPRTMEQARKDWGIPC